MLGTVGGDFGAPGPLPMLGTVTGGGGHTAVGGEAACTRRNAATVRPAKSIPIRGSNRGATGPLCTALHRRSRRPRPRHVDLYLNIRI